MSSNGVSARRLPGGNTPEYDYRKHFTKKNERK